MSVVLVVDDKDMLRDSVGATLQRAGHTALAAPDGQAALDIIAKRRPDAVVTDLKMPGMTGIDLLERIREFDEDLPVVVMTAFGAVETAVKAMKLGAFDYIAKPFEGDELLIAVKRAIEHARLKKENALLRLENAAAGGSTGAGGSVTGAAGPRGLDRLIGDSAAMRAVKEQVASVAASHGNVLITGESGAGKEVVARAVHDLSPRAAEPYVAMNCPALAESLLESELFGHEKGAFTGADRLRKGRFELADRGTLLLDEVSEVGPKIQAKLLRVLQEREFERVGSSTSIGIDVRVIATTNRDLQKAIGAGDFRQDLFFRLNVLPVRLPALRERAEDVPMLAGAFVGAVARREGRDAPPITPEAIGLLCAYHWPGNVRELMNLCERAVALTRGGAIDADLIRPWLDSGSVPVGSGHAAPTANGALPRAHSVIEAAPMNGSLNGAANASFITLEVMERNAIVEALNRFHGHRQKTAQALGIGVRTLGLKLKKWKEERLVPESL